MKQCQNCSTKNSNGSKFCSSCGASLEGVTETSDSENVPFSKAKVILDAGAKKVRTTMSIGAEKAKEAITIGKEKMKMAQSGATATSYTPLEKSPSQTASLPGGGWDSSVNPDDAVSVKIKRYPFFQDESEITIAVLGENAAAADLDGRYQMPYAVLTQQRLYCKNEAGNFAVSTTDIQTVKDGRQNPYAWTFILAMLLPTILPFLVFHDLLYSGGNKIAFIFSVAACICSYYFHYRRDLLKTMFAMAIICISWGFVL